MSLMHVGMHMPMHVMTMARSSSVHKFLQELSHTDFRLASVATGLFARCDGVRVALTGADACASITRISAIVCVGSHPK